MILRLLFIENCPQLSASHLNRSSNIFVARDLKYFSWTIFRLSISDGDWSLDSGTEQMFSSSEQAHCLQIILTRNPYNYHGQFWMSIQGWSFHIFVACVCLITFPSSSDCYTSWIIILSNGGGRRMPSNVPSPRVVTNFASVCHQPAHCPQTQYHQRK